MTWIEQLFHFAPDDGDGSLEVGIAAGAAVALAMLIVGAIRLGPAMKRWVVFLGSQTRDHKPAPLHQFDGRTK